MPEANGPATQAKVKEIMADIRTATRETNNKGELLEAISQIVEFHIVRLAKAALALGRNSIIEDLHAPHAN